MTAFNPWRLLRFMPKSVLTTVKRCTGPKARLWVREHMGARHTVIPDTIIQISDGRRFHVGPDRVYWSLYFGLPYEIENTGIIRRILRPGDSVIDVGANFGWFTTLFASLVGSEGHVYAFEPVSGTFQRLKENVEINHLSERVTTLPKAVGENECEAQIHIFKEKSHACASLSTLNQEEYTEETIRVTTVAHLIEQHGIKSIDFLKCDAEGSELSVLRGCRDILQSDQAPMILVELNDETSKAFGYARSDVWKFLAEMGYDHFYQIRSESSVRRIGIEEIGDLDVLLCDRGGRIERRIGSSREGLLAAA